MRLVKHNFVHFEETACSNVYGIYGKFEIDIWPWNTKWTRNVCVYVFVACKMRTEINLTSRRWIGYAHTI